MKPQKSSNLTGEKTKGGNCDQKWLSQHEGPNRVESGVQGNQDCSEKELWGSVVQDQQQESSGMF